MPLDPTITSNDGMLRGIDILEESIRFLDLKLLEILLSDHTTHKNNLWATSDYSHYGPEFEDSAEITPDCVTGRFADLIQPRIAKSTATQIDRTRNKAEVFTPSWVCNKQNNLVDEQWFGRKDVFNRKIGTTWEPITGRVSFDGAKKDWTKYVDDQRLEISCGEAP